MTRQKAIKIAKAKLSVCTSFLEFLAEEERKDPDAMRDKLIAKFSLIVKTLVIRETETLEEIIEQIDSKKPAKSL